MKIEHPYEFVQGSTPLLISMPHPGLLLPAEVADLLTPEARALPDTDWHIPQLYAFAAQMGASLLMARYSRFAIDLNRPEDDAPLYQSATTGLFPDTLFDGTSIFLPGARRSDAIKSECKERIWRPYHGKL
ncbi:MAG TPA: N-formylglutamate amidohydrolase, partial [Dongiaceae bacterium]|nr:N-formylglutamate amidohydrolase [Dongiaceae bacterium]